MGFDRVEQRNFSLFMRKFCDSCEICWRVVLSLCRFVCLSLCIMDGPDHWLLTGSSCSSYIIL